jgi:hypothetical protein
LRPSHTTQPKNQLVQNHSASIVSALRPRPSSRKSSL